mmetsp:Transcript_2630/g.7970  ORF Transcript_2630/g.7970 Transcript_2630/m.7970 type:complete len:221 (+) Transcript_2630:1499-2161(+)
MCCSKESRTCAICAESWPSVRAETAATAAADLLAISAAGRAASSCALEGARRDCLGRGLLRGPACCRSCAMGAPGPPVGKEREPPCGTAPGCAPGANDAPVEGPTAVVGTFRPPESAMPLPQCACGAAAAQGPGPPTEARACRRRGGVVLPPPLGDPQTPCIGASGVYGRLLAGAWCPPSGPQSARGLVGRAEGKGDGPLVCGCPGCAAPEGPKARRVGS